MRLAVFAASQAKHGFPVYAIAGIANPAPFYGALRAAGIVITPVPLADHGGIPVAFWKKLSADAWVIMTAKDAVKINPAATYAAQCWVLPWQAILPNAFILQIENTLKRTQHKRAQHDEATNT